MAMLHRVVILMSVALSCCQTRPTDVKSNLADPLKEETKVKLLKPLTSPPIDHLEFNKHSEVKMSPTKVKSNFTSLLKEETKVKSFKPSISLTPEGHLESNKQSEIKENSAEVKSILADPLKDETQVKPLKSLTLPSPLVHLKSDKQSGNKKIQTEVIKETEVKNDSRIVKPMSMWAILPLGEENGKNQSVYILAASSETRYKYADTQKSTYKDIEEFYKWKEQVKWNSILDKIGLSIGTLGSLTG